VTPSLLAHGFGDAGDLPITLQMLVLLSGGAVLGVAAALSARAARGEQPTRRGGVRLPAALTGLVDHAASRAALRLAGGALLGVAAVTAAVGPDDFIANPAPALFFSVFGVVVLLGGSLLVGPLWRLANPLPALSGAIARLSGDAEERLVRSVPARLGVRPAAALLALYVWTDLVVGRRPLGVLVVLAAHVVAQLAGAAVYGRAWYGHGDGFEVYSRVVGWLAPLDRDADGRLVLRGPRPRMARLDPPAGLLAVVAVLLGAHVFDSLTDTLAWQQLLFGRPRLAVQTAGLAACIGAVGAVAAGATHARFLRPALVPLVAAYAIAHHLGPLLAEVQQAAIALSDPFGRDADLLGLAGRRVTEEVMPASLAAVAQIGAFLGLHVLAVAVAHDRAIARYDPRGARAVQFPVRALIVASTVGGVAVRFAPQ